MTNVTSQIVNLINSLSLNEMQELQKILASCIAAREKEDRQAMVQYNERMRQIGQIMNAANIVSIASWQKRDRRVYFNFFDGNRRAFGMKIGSTKYPIDACLYIDGSDKYPPGLHVNYDSIRKQLEETWAAILQILEMTSEEFVARGMRINA